MLSVVSLFAGIGSADLAFARAGAPPVAVVEIDEHCRGVLALLFPDAAQFGDITEVTSGQLTAAGFVPARGCLVGGFPCQDLSPAGHRAGLGGSRSGLFWQIIRLARELRPRWLVLENVADLVHAVCGCPGDRTCVANARAVRCGKSIRGVWQPDVAHSVAGGACPGGCMRTHGGALGTVLGALAELGYGYAYRVLDAQYAGLAQRRKRCFIVGCLGDGASAAEILLEPEGRAGYSAPSRAARQDVAGTPGTRAGGGGTTDIDQIGAYVPGTVGALGTGNGHSGGWRIGAEEAAGGQLIPFDMAQITHAENRSTARDGDPAPTLNQAGALHVAGTLRSHPRPGSNSDGAITAVGMTSDEDVSGALTAHHGRNSDQAWVAAPVAVRGRAGGSQIEAGRPGEPAHALRASAGGSSRAMVASLSAHADFAAGDELAQPVTASKGQPGMVAAPLTSGSRSDGVSIAGRHQEDDYNIVTHTLSADYMRGSEDGSGHGTPIIPVTRTTDTGQYDPAHVSAAQARSCEVLRTVRDSDGEEAAAEWLAGIAAALRSAEVLRPDVHGGSLRRAAEPVDGLVNDSLPRPQTDTTGPVRDVRGARRARRSSSRRGSHEQRSGESGEIVSLLSHPGASREGCLRGLRRACEGSRVLLEALSALEALGRSPDGESQPAQAGAASDDVTGGAGVSVAIRRLTPRLPRMRAPARPARRLDGAAARSPRQAGRAVRLGAVRADRERDGSARRGLDCAAAHFLRQGESMRLSRRLASVLPLAAIYIGSVALANWLVTRYGLISVGFGLVAPAGTFAIGGAIMTRDLLQDAAGRVGVLTAILAGAGLSYLIASHQIALASGVTFLFAETIEFAVYTPLRRRVGWGTGRWASVIAVANITGALADTLLFLTLAGFPVTFATVGGQMLGKAYVTAAVIAVAALARRRAPAAAGHLA